MSQGNSPTFFKSDSGSAGGSLDYLRDNFQDMSTPATNNSGLTDNANTNPFGEFFANTDTPVINFKQLRIESMEPLPTGKWISGRPTYKIIFKENFPNISAYAFGDVRFFPFNSGPQIEVRGPTSGYGIIGVMKRAWVTVEPRLTSLTTNNDQVSIDGSNTSTINVGQGTDVFIQTGGSIKDSFYPLTSSDLTDDLHHIQVRVNNVSPYYLTGFGVQFQTSDTNVYFNPGSTYYNKQKLTSVTGSSQALLSMSGLIGGNVLFQKNDANVYTQLKTELPFISSTGIGSSGTNSMGVVTGFGGSFLAGYGVVAYSGTSQYTGIVRQVSTDTLTLSPTLSFGLSGLIYKNYYASPTAVINGSLLVNNFSFDPFGLNPADYQGMASLVLGTSSVFQSALTGSFRDRDKNYRTWWTGVTITETTFEERNLKFNSLNTGFFQAEGNFQAAEIEFAGGTSGILHATFHVNGVVAFGINESFTGTIKRTIFTDAQTGINSFYMTPGASLINVGIKKINFYQNAESVGASFGKLSSILKVGEYVNRGAQSATNINFGVAKKIYADDMKVIAPSGGNWIRGITTIYAGGIVAGTFIDGHYAEADFFGDKFTVHGVASASFLVTLNGVSTTAAIGQVVSTTLSMHTLRVTNKSATLMISSMDFYAPIQEQKLLQTFEPEPEPTPKQRSVFRRYLSTTAITSNIVVPDLSVFSLTPGAFYRANTVIRFQGTGSSNTVKAGVVRFKTLGGSIFWTTEYNSQSLVAFAGRCVDSFVFQAQDSGFRPEITNLVNTSLNGDGQFGLDGSYLQIEELNDVAWGIG